MLKTQFFGRAGLSMIVAGALLGACGDDGASTDEQAQSADAGVESDNGGTARAGTSSTARAGRGGSAATSTAVAGRGDSARPIAASAGRGGQRPNAAATSGAGSAGRGGAASPGGSAGDTTGADAGITEDGSRLILDDGQIAAVISSVNSGEISLGTLALTRASTPAVRDYAQSMVTMHNEAQVRQSALVTALSLTPSPSPLGVQFGQDATNVMTQLSQVSDADFETSYIQSQVTAHLKVLMLINEQLLPNVSAASLREELTTTQIQVTAHLEAARSVLGILEDSTDAGVGVAL